MATVVLVHGLGRTSRAMWPLARAARARGLRVVAIDYRSRRGGIASHAAALALQLHERAPEGPLWFVTHSLGGIVLRYAVAHGMLAAARVERAVLLAPPNQGSEIADFWWDRPWPGLVGRRLMGPSLGELRTSPEATVMQLPPVGFPCGVIAGTRSLTRLSSRFIDGPNDGKVAVRRAAVAGMRELLELPATHTFILAMPSVIAQTFHFLEHGRFERGADASVEMNGE